MHRIHSQRKLSPSHVEGSSPAHAHAITITISNQQNPSQTVTTSEPTVTVGRNPRSSTLCLSDPSISGSHAAFQFVGDNWTIRDVGSLNGTFLNKMRLEPHTPYRLSSDDVVHFGGDLSAFKVYFSSQSLDLSSTSFPRGSLSIAKSKSFCDRLNDMRIHDASVDIDESFVSWNDGRIECGVASLRGKNKKESEDRHCLAQLRPDDRCSAFVLGVFDGHCGAGAAEEAMEAIQEEMGDLVRDVNDTEAFVRAFLATDDRIEDEAGCTATCVTIFQREEGRIAVRAANVGDSMAYMVRLGHGRGSGSGNKDDDGDDDDDKNKNKNKNNDEPLVTLTQDHRLTNPEERVRLQSHGVIPDGDSGTTRLYGLNLARALGDRFLKDEDLGLSAEPHVSDVVELDGDGEALIVIASDGVWDVMSGEDCMDMAMQVDRDTHGSVVKVATALAREAEALGSKDDVTVVACRVWSENAFGSGAFRGGIKGREEGEDEEGDEEGAHASRRGNARDEGPHDRRDATTTEQLEIDDDLAVGFGGMLI